MNRRPKLTLNVVTSSEGTSLRVAKDEAPAPEEAAAVVAAIEQFLRDTAPPPAQEAAPVSGWLRTARLEAVEREPGLWR